MRLNLRTVAGCCQIDKNPSYGVLYIKLAAMIRITARNLPNLKLLTSVYTLRATAVAAKFSPPLIKLLSAAKLN